jgi:selenocysteine lyase/cysteine desulfurase
VAPECYIIVDGIQHAPHGTMEVARYGADAYVFSPYKAYSRLSLGFAWVGDRVHALPHEHMLGKDGADWELGSRDPGFYAAQSAVVDYYAWLGEHFLQDTPSHASRDRAALVAAGTAAMARHEAALIGLLLHGDAHTPGLLSMSEVTLVGPATAQGREGIVSFNLRGMNSPSLVQALARRHIRVHARVTDGYSGHILGALGLQDCLRISLAHYNTPEEVRACLRAVAQARAELAS